MLASTTLTSGDVQRDFMFRSTTRVALSRFFEGGQADRMQGYRLLPMASVFTLSNLKHLTFCTGSRILGLGDLGANGLPIAIGKL